VAVIQEAWIRGISTSRVDELVQAMGLNSIFKSTVSKLCNDIDERLGEFLNRPLTGEWPYVWFTPPTSRCAREGLGGVRLVIGDAHTGPLVRHRPGL
jgi:hypothetical protein